MDAAILDIAGFENVNVLGKNDAWYQIGYDNGTAWIYGDFVDVVHEDLIPKVLPDPYEIIDYGMSFIGTPYVWGGNSLVYGVDCSGLTQQLFNTFDIEISRVSYNQANDGIPVEKSDLQAGDLVFFNTIGSNISHVGIYIDEDQFLHSDSTRGVMVETLSNPYYSRNYVKGVRILN